MAEQGKITISVGVDSGQAIDGLKDLQDGLKDMGDTSGKAGAKVVDSFEDIDKAAKDSAKAVDKSSSSAQKAMKETAKVAQKSGKETTDAMDQADTIQGLEGLQDVTGELDSSLKGLGGAVGLVSPEMERLFFVTGELSGGLENSARLTNLLGGNLGSLLRVGGALAVGTATLYAAYRKFSGGLEEATQRLKESNAAMRAGIAEAKVYGSRLRALKFQLGLVTAAEMERRNAQAGALDLMGERAVQNNEEIQQLSALRQAQEQNVRLLERTQRGIVQVAGARHTLETVTSDLVGTTEQETIELQGQAAIIATASNNWQEYSNAVSRANLTGNFAADNALKIQLAHEHLNEETAKTIAANIEIAQRIEFLDRSTAAYSETLNRNQAMIAITNAIQSGNIGSMVRARESLEDLRESQREAASATLERAIASHRAAAAAEAEAQATENSTEATEEEIDVQGARMRAADMLAEARGAEAQAERQYAKAIMEVNALQVQGAITEEEMTELVLAAFQKRSEAIDELKAKQVDLNETTKLSLTDYGKAVTAVQDLTGNALAAMADDIDRREAEALAAAEGNLEKQAEIKAQFDQERAGEMSRVFKANQTAAISGAIISGAQAAVAALAPPPTGFGPNLGLAMLPILAGNVAAQIALIANQKPSFHQGGMIPGQGDQMITAQGGEAVLNRAAVASLGGESGVDSLNAGGAAGGAVVVQMVYKQRVLDELIVDNLAKGGPLKRAINDSSRRARRGRIGGRL